MKRHTALTLACTLALSLTACDDKRAAKEGAEITEMTEIAESGVGTEKQAEVEFRITPFQAVDKEDYSVKVVNYGNVDEDQEYLQLNLQNKSENKSYVFAFLNLEGNGIVLITSGVDETVEPGQEKQINLIFQKNSTYSLKSLDDLTFRLAIRGSNTRSQKEETDVFHICPYGEDEGVSYVSVPNNSYGPLGDNEILEAGVTECKWDQFSNENVFFYLRSKTNKRLSTDSEKGSMSGRARSTMQYFEVGSEQPLFGIFTRQDLTMPEAEIKELQFNLRVQNVDNLVGGSFLDETYIVAP